MYHVGIDASPPPIRYRSIMNDTIDTYLIPDRRFSLCRYLADTVTVRSRRLRGRYRSDTEEPRYRPRYRLWPIPDTNTYAYVGRGVNRRRNCRYRRNQVTTSISSVSKGVLVSCHWRGAATERLDNGAYRRRSVSATCGPLSFLIRNSTPPDWPSARRSGGRNSRPSPGLRPGAAPLAPAALPAPPAPRAQPAQVWPRRRGLCRREARRRRRGTSSCSRWCRAGRAAASAARAASDVEGLGCIG